ncbi:hypothetical protein FOZ63_026625 [Perkinsus olseni]|uniref:DUF2423 domain-containing protein n=1 Tax=Perkinsus olseni TaxID=32597 RepID=A0A7J6REC2_PEROL|nr:hypothetical protein FOZ63_026625 [Perkinsus olseni]
MAKSIRSKVKKRFRTCKRQLVSATIDKKRLQDTNQRLREVATGVFVKPTTPKNAFLYPDDPAAAFPKVLLLTWLDCVNERGGQVIVAKPLDFRSEAMPHSGYAITGNRRKYGASEFESIPRVVVGDDIGGSVRAKLTFAQANDDDEDTEMGATRAVAEPVPATGVITQGDLAKEVAREKMEGSNVKFQPVVPAMVSKLPKSQKRSRDRTSLKTRRGADRR